MQSEHACYQRMPACSNALNAAAFLRIVTELRDCINRGIGLNYYI
jgi:hypothetical protein